MKLPKMAVFSGNQNPPEQLRETVRRLGQLLTEHGFTIRTGCMDGMEKMVMETLPSVELHIPWKGFNQIQQAHSTFNTDEVKEFTKRYLPDWGTIKEVIQAFYCKDTRLVLGKNLKEPAQVSIIWSEDGIESPAVRTSRSGHAGMIATLSRAMSIPVFNLNNPDAETRLRQFLQG